MPRLLIVTSVPATLAALLLPFAHHFRARGWLVDALTGGGPLNTEITAAFDRVWQIEWSRSPLAWRNLTMAPHEVRSLVEREHYDIVHVHTAVAAFVTRLALCQLRRSSGLQVIYTAHGFNFERGVPLHKNLAFLALEKLAGQWTDYQVVINRTDEAAARRFGLVPPDRICYMPGIGIDRSYYNPQRVNAQEVAALRQSLGLASQTPALLMVAEFILRKRHTDILQAFALLNRPDVHLLLAGNGPLFTKMQELAQELGIAAHTHFLGFRRDIPLLMRSSSALLLPSRQEGLPRSVLEALALGTPVIGTDIRGVRDLLADGAGLLCAVGDVKGLAQAMARIVDDPVAAQSMGQRGQAQAAAYDLQTVIALHDDLYERALAARPQLVRLH